MVPAEDIVKSDKFRNHSKDFFDDLKKGRKDPKDFERYIFGKHRAYAKDERDRQEDEERKYTDSIRRSI